MFSFAHKDDEFFDLFVESAKLFHKGALMLSEVLDDYKLAGKMAAEIIDIEHQADTVNDKIIDKLNLTFITPIDREDIYSLANGLDDGVDHLQGTMQRLHIYRINHIMPGAVTLTKLLIEATQEVIDAFSLLKNIKKNQQAILAATQKIGRLESQGDDVYRHEVADLFDNQSDPFELIKWKDLLENLEDTLDHCEELSDMIRGVVMKYA